MLRTSSHDQVTVHVKWGFLMAAADFFSSFIFFPGFKLLTWNSDP